ncbi:MAG: HD-GYP domain-containing protein [Selenomonadaceae bacterium]|nr:HD-GYP domain-containing protein [Selenomonadaceae bacterium]MDD7055748.1 HD-GYP domain-containing protein [Selenomonadaceae bacterium]MDY3916155.1 HD-GYP domain-containing protein [Selenomonadaceae bacterium]
MLRLPVKKLKQGMILAQSIFNQRGASYLVKGQPITKGYIKQLEKVGIPTVTVTTSDPDFQLLPPDDIVAEETRANAIKHVYHAFQTTEQDGHLDVDMMEDVAEKIIFDLIDRKANLVQLTDIRLHDTYTFGHSVNVAILSSMLGMLCHYTKKDLQILTLGALLHDLGKIAIPEEILTKNTGLTDEEFAVIKAHPLRGAQRIHEMENMLPHTALLSAIASEHHEHIDGSGYPRGLKDEEIHRYAKIVAIADVYDALTSERPYKKAYTPNVAHNIMCNVIRGQFDPKLLNLFFNNVALYPVGTILKTDYGFGIVKKSAFGKTETPTIVVFANMEGRPIEPYTIDLSTVEDGNHKIHIVVSDNDLRHFIHNLAFDPSVYLK